MSGRIPITLMHPELGTVTVEVDGYVVWGRGIIDGIYLNGRRVTKSFDEELVRQALTEEWERTGGETMAGHDNRSKKRVA